MPWPAGARVGSQGSVLGEQHERPIRVAAASDRPLRRRDLRHRAAEVDRGCPPGPVGGPRDRAIEGPIDLEDAGAIAEPLVCASGPRRQPVARDRQRGARRHVEEDDPARWQVRECRHLMIGLDLAAERGELRRERVGDPDEPPRTIGQPAAWAYSPSTSPNDDVSGRVRSSIEWAARPAKAARAASPAKCGRAMRVAGSSAGSPKRARASGMPRQVDDRTEQLLAQLVRVADERAEETPPHLAVRSAADSPDADRPPCRRRTAR